MDARDFILGEEILFKEVYVILRVSYFIEALVVWFGLTVK